MNEEIVMHLSSAADRWERAHPIIGFGELRVHDALRDAVRCIKETSAQVPRWISVDERLPEKIEAVNIVWVNRQPVSYYAHIKDKPFTGTGYYHNGKWWWYSATCEDYLKEYGWNEFDLVDECIEITHWMPLPEPPKEGE